MKIVLFSFLFLTSFFAIAQTQAEMEKVLKEIQRDIDKAQKEQKRQTDILMKDPDLKKAMQKQSDDNSSDVNDEEKLLLKLPPKNQKLLSDYQKFFYLKPCLLSTLKTWKVNCKKKLIHQN